MDKKLAIPEALVACAPVRPADRTVRWNGSGPFVHTVLGDGGASTVLCNRTETPCLGGILLRERGGSGEARVVRCYPDSPSYDHGATLDGLKPGAEYEYRWLVFRPDGSGEAVGEVRAFRVPAPLADFPLRDGPWLTNVDTTAATVGWRSSSPVPGGIVYRKKGETGFRELLAHRNGQVLPGSTAQIVDLEGLEPGAEYEYRLACLDVATGETLVRGDYSFRTFSAEAGECRALILSDTHGNSRFEERAFGFTRAGELADFVALLGDSVWDGIYSPGGDDLMEDLVRPVVDFCGHSKPIVATRGNHEWNGPYAADWSTWMSARKGRCYSAFTDGPCLFVVLDSGPMAEIPRNRYYRELFDEQRAWLLDEVIPSKAWREARFRVAMSHFATFGYPGDDAWRGPFAETVLAPFNSAEPGRRIHLLVGGHTHGYARVDACSSVFHAMPDYVAPNRAPTLAGEPVRFTTVINDGPVCGPMEYTGVTLYANGEKLVLTVFDQDMRVIDSFSIDREGRTTSHPSVRRYE